MKKFGVQIIVLVFLALVIVNIGIFVKSIVLGADMNRYELETKKLAAENLDLENQMYEMDSLSFAASQAAKLNFTQSANPIYLENLKYALNR